jgi:hypothetical protein
MHHNHKDKSLTLRQIEELTPALGLDMCLSCPDVDEKDSLKFPGPTSMVLFCGRLIQETDALLPA